MTSKIRKIMLDTNIYIDYFTKRNPDDHKKAQFLLEGQHNNEYQIVLPTIIIAELACHPDLRNLSLSPNSEQYQERVSITQEFLTTAIEQPDIFLVWDLTISVALKAGEIGTQFTLKGADAAIIASAFHSDCSHLYTRDDQILKISHSISPLKIELPPEPSPLSTLF